jgi:hypothetical protein
MGLQTRYLKAAATSQLNIVLFAGLMLFGLVSWNIIPVIAALAGEAAWLCAAPLLPVFRAAADRKEKKFRAIDRASELESMISALPAPERGRYVKLDEIVRSIREISAEPGNPVGDLLANSGERIDGLRPRFARLLASRASYRTMLERSDPDEIEKRRRETETALTGADDRVREIRQRQLEILEQRRDKLQGAKADLGVIDAQLESFEDLVMLFKEQAVSLTRPEDLTAHIDGLMSQIEVTERTMSEFDTSFASFDKELGKEPDIKRLQ